MAGIPEGLQLRLLHGGRIQTSRPWRMEAHAHVHHELIVPLHGSLLLNPEGKDGPREGQVFGPGSVLLYPSKWAHAEEARFERRFDLLYFGFQGGVFQGCRTVWDEQGRIGQMGLWLLQHRKPGEPPDSHAKAFFRAMLAEFWRLSAGLREETLAEKVRKYLQGHYPEAITLEFLARHFGAGKFHLLRSYAAETGTTPMADLGRIRLEEAKALLETTSLPLKTIADAVGLSSASHLSKKFRGHFGHSPSGLRGHPQPRE